MARTCSASGPAYISAGSIPGNVGSADRTVCCWMQTSGPVSTRQIFYREGDNPTGQWFLEINASTFRITGSAAIDSGITPSTNTWYHVAAVLSSGTFSIYTDGVFRQNGTITLGTSGTTFFIGAGSGGALPLIGRIAEVAKYNGALSATDIASLAKGLSPKVVRRRNLDFYAPLVREVRDIRNALALTDTGPTTVSDHPRSYI